MPTFIFIYILLIVVITFWRHHSFTSILYLEKHNFWFFKTHETSSFCLGPRPRLLQRPRINLRDWVLIFKTETETNRIFRGWDHLVSVSVLRTPNCKQFPGGGNHHRWVIMRMWDQQFAGNVWFLNFVMINLLIFLIIRFEFIEFGPIALSLFWRQNNVFVNHHHNSSLESFVAPREPLKRSTSAETPRIVSAN